MTQSARQRLQQRLSLRYRYLRLRLTGLLGSVDNATAALNETWLQLEHVPSASSPKDVDAYLLRMAAHIAYKNHRQDRPYLNAQELSDLYELPDEHADTERIVQGRQLNQQLLSVLAQLPERRRAILIAARVHGDTNQHIAKEFGVSVSTVEREIRLAVKMCQQQMVQLSAPDSNGTGKLPHAVP